ncbi:MAG TPA: HAD family hydrolase [Acidimicrobiia bacterium]|nr:HAD family hydrolase [Acidimicrobiia bacterium]
MASAPGSGSTGAVILDFYGTLAEAVAWGPRLEDVLRVRGLTAPDDWGRSTFDARDGHEHLEHSRSRDHYVAWERERLEALALACGAPRSTLAALVDELYRATKSFRLRVYDEVAEVLDDLARSGVKLAVCSNWDWDLPDVLGSLGIAEPFDVIVTSARAGARKPHPRIYAHTVEGLGVEPARCLFVGDSRGPDVEGPTAHGMRAVLIRRSEGGGDGDGFTGPTLRTLAELPAFL